MTQPINPTLVPELSTPYPDASDQDTFDARAAALFLYLVNTLTPGANTLASQTYTNALAAAAAADLAVTAVDAELWDAATNYTTGMSAISPTDMKVYRRLAPGGVNATDPAASALWLEAWNSKVDKSGTTMTGNLDVPSLNGGPLGGFRNRIINGCFRFNQMNASGSIMNGAIADCWDVSTFSLGSGSVTHSAQFVSVVGNEKAVMKTVTTAVAATLGATSFAAMVTRLEGVNISDLFGKTFTLSFWVKSPKTGVHSVTLNRAGSADCFVLPYTVATANTLQKVELTVSGGLPAGGAGWITTTGSASLVLIFPLVVGSDYVTASPQTWVSAVKYSTQTINIVDTVGAVFGLSSVQLEIGPVETPFEYRSYGIELALCQRYYEIVPFAMLRNALNGGIGSTGNMGFYKVEKAKAPTISAAPWSNLNAGDTFVKPGFPGDGLWAAGEAEKSAFTQLTAGTFTSPNQPRDVLPLKIIADARL